MVPRPAPLVALLLTGLVAACGGDPAPAGPGPLPDDPESAAMARRLQALVGAGDPQDNLYRNAERAELLAARIEAAEAAGQGTGMLRAQYAEQLLHAGRNEQALEVLTDLQARFAALGERANPRALHELERFLILTHLRLAEQANCVEHHSAESCLLPLEGGGVHLQTAGGRAAHDLLLDRLRRDGKDWEARWLLNLAAMTLGRWPDGVPERFRIPREAFASGADPGRFVDVAGPAGVAVEGLAGGVVMEDLDGDGRLDLLVSSWGLSDPLVLLRNTGDGRFEDVSAAAGLSGLGGGLNMVHADPDNDGDADVLVLRGAWFEVDGGHPNSLLVNDGAGHFVDRTESAGLLSFHPTQTAAWGDYDGDGWLDLFIGNETGPHERHPCELYHNQGDGSFALVDGIQLEAYVKGTAWGDVDNDGDLDLYISRIDGPNLLLRNDGQRGPGSVDERVPAGGRPAAAPARPWAFTDIAGQAGVTEPKRSFPTWFFDHDNDGWLDLFVSGFKYGSAGWVCKDVLGLPHKGITARLYRNLGAAGDGPRFADVSAAAGLDKVLLAMGSNVGDIDEDGFPDLYLATGEPDFAALYPNRMFLNDAGRRFLDVTTAGGFGHVQKGHGVAFGDLDADGDQDVYAVMGGAYEGDRFRNALFLNPGHGRRWLTLELTGTTSNRAGLGTRVRVTVEEPGGRRDIHAVVGTGGSFGSSSLALELGLGAATRIVELELWWSGSGWRQVFDDVPLDACLAITEGDPVPRRLERPVLPLGR